ncbi:DUF3696 domain-containing protein [bacterium]|nr:DUF3696 domain-containing protein [bacterium]
MLTTISLKNFKCFAELSLPLAPFTILTGFNGAGKSSVLQGILLVVQALRTDYNTASLPLNGDLIKLGTPGEVLRDGCESNSLLVGLETGQSRISWNLSSDSKSESHKYKNFFSILSVIQNEKITAIDGELVLHNLLPANNLVELDVQAMRKIKETIFITALRTGALNYHPSPEIEPVTANVGINGEYAPWFFQEYDDAEIPETKRHPSAKDEVTLRRQYIAWASSIFTGTEATAKKIGEWSDLVEIGLRIDKNKYRRPSNIGYGISYAFPIIVAALLAKPEQILIVDSPEAHLHPRGQSQMGRFLAHMAQAGVQVIVETHSDHLLNGVRLAVMEQTISNESVAIHFFRNTEPVDGKGPARVISPVIDSKGSLDSWPEGFFDQSEKDIASLMGWGK